jgi:hypothetical protein
VETGFRPDFPETILYGAAVPPELSLGMTNSLIHLRPILLLSAGILPLLASCAKTGRPESVADATCPAERAEFIGAAQALSAVPAASADAYWAQLRRTDPDPGAAAQRTAMELTVLATAIDRIDIGYAALQTCRLGRVDGLRARIVEGTLAPTSGADQLAEVRQAFEAEMAQAREAVGHIENRQAIFQTAVDRLAARPDRGGAVRSTAAEPASTTAYMVKENAEIFARPDAGSPGIADLRKGQRVQGPDGGPASGWITLTLNDGSLGYADVGVLRPVQMNASALQPAARTQASLNGDPIAALVLSARATVSVKSRRFASRIDRAAETSPALFAGTAAPSPTAAMALPENLAQSP